MGEIVARAKSCYEQAVEEYGPKACIVTITAATAACVVEELREKYIEGSLGYLSPIDVFNNVLAALTP
jgi:hypothetical protein